MRSDSPGLEVSFLIPVKGASRSSGVASSAVLLLRSGCMLVVGGGSSECVGKSSPKRSFRGSCVLTASKGRDAAASRTPVFMTTVPSVPTPTGSVTGGSVLGECGNAPAIIIE